MLMSWSPNGITDWTPVTGLENIFSNRIYGIVYAAEKFVATNTYSSGNIGSSADGDSGWVLRGSLAGAYVRGLAYGAGKFIAVGDNNQIAHSSDGVTWYTVDDIEGYGVVYGNGRFIIVDAGQVHIIGQ